MALSLQEQLLKIGVVDKKKAKKTQHQQRQNNNKIRKAAKSGKVINQPKLKEELEQVEQEKQRRDRELNKKRDAAIAKKAALAEVRQLIEQHKLAIDKNAEVAYHFTHQSKIKKMYVEVAQHTQLTKGQLAIAVDDQNHSLIPDSIAEKIEERLPHMIVRIKAEEHRQQEDDPYADYQVPDDLMW